MSTYNDFLKDGLFGKASIQQQHILDLINYLRTGYQVDTNQAKKTINLIKALKNQTALNWGAWAYGSGNGSIHPSPFPSLVNNQPVSYTFESPVGYRKSTKTMHEGVDLGVVIGTPVLALFNGTIAFSGTASGYGNFISIKADSNFPAKDVSNPVYINYGHLSKIYVKKGDRVRSGQTIGLSGNTGHSFGPHLHLEIRGGNIDGEVGNPELYLMFIKA